MDFVFTEESEQEDNMSTEGSYSDIPKSYVDSQCE